MLIESMEEFEKALAACFISEKEEVEEEKEERDLLEEFKKDML